MPMKSIVLLVPLALLAASPARAQLDPAAVQRCRIIAEAAARLACYDAIALPGIGSRAGWGAPVATAPATAPAAAPGPGPGGDFGLSRPAPEAAADRVVSRVVGRVEDFPNGLKLTLENGQVWQLSESATGFYNLESPRVTITRGLISGFVMAMDGVNAPLKVRRIR
jgi:hypothetical protein